MKIHLVIMEEIINGKVDFSFVPFENPLHASIYLNEIGEIMSRKEKLFSIWHNKPNKHFAYEYRSGNFASCYIRSKELITFDGQNFDSYSTEEYIDILKSVE